MITGLEIILWIAMAIVGALVGAIVLAIIFGVIVVAIRSILDEKKKK